MVHPAAGRRSVQAGDHRDHHPALGGFHEVEVAIGAGVVLLEVGEVRGGLGVGLRARVEHAPDLERLVGDLLLEEGGQHDGADAVVLQPGELIQVGGHGTGRRHEGGVERQAEVRRAQGGHVPPPPPGCDVDMSGRPLDARELLVPPPALVHISLGQAQSSSARSGSLRASMANRPSVSANSLDGHGRLV